MNNYDQAEIHKFNTIAARWWDPNSEFKPLHDINPVRLNYITNQINIADKHVLDVGCGGGILSESMANLGAHVTGIDLGETTLEVAKLHGLESGITVNYQLIAAEEFAKQQAAMFDIVTCMEMLEHVPDPSAIIHACSQLVKPGGLVFFSTLNRNPKSYLYAILAAEYLLKLLPKGTHDYKQFIRPSELDAWARGAGLGLKNLSGIQYNPLTNRYTLYDDVSVNYIACYLKDAAL